MEEIMTKKNTCWSCELDLIVGEVVHNDTGPRLS